MKTLSTQNWTRRRLLQATALSAGLTPFMPINALPAPPRKRVIFVYTPLGAPNELWQPRGCGEAMSLPFASAPLAPVKQHCTFLTNFHMPDGGFGHMKRVLGGGFDEAHATTLDIHLGAALRDAVQVPNLHLGAHAKFESISAKDLETIGFASSAAAVYGHFFNETNDDTPIDRKFRAALPSFPATDFDTEVDLQIELSALALSRNVTNVVTLMWGEQQGEFYLPESFTEIRSDFHSAIHTASRQSYAIFRAYLSAKLAYLIQLLEVMRDENNRSLLETTLVVHVSDQGDGDNHDGTNPPYFIAGSKDLFRNGTVVNAGGASQYDLMDTIAEAYGLQGVQYGTKKIEGLIRI